MNKLRSQYIYRLIGQIQNKKSRLSSKGNYYQLSLLCENNPSVNKLFVFDDKLTNPQIWPTIEADNCFGKKYLFFCKNYQGYYYLVDWKLLSNNSENNSAHELPNKPSQEPTLNHDQK